MIATARSLLVGNSLRAQLLRGGVGSLAIKFTSVGLSLGLAVVLARTLGAEGFGVYTYVFALVSLLAIPAQFGLPNLVMRETAKEEVGQQWGLMRGVWRWAGLNALLLSMILAVASGAITWWFAPHFTTLQLITFGWGLLFIPLLALGSLRGAALRGLRKVVQGQLPEQIIRPVLLIGFVLIAAALTQGHITPDHAMAFNVLAAGIGFAIGGWLLWRGKPTALDAKPIPNYESRQWLKAVLPFALIAGMGALNRQVDIIMIGIFKTAADVGVYRVAARGAILVALGVTAINAITGPYFARFYSQRDLKQLQKLATMSARANFLMALPATIVFILFGVPIIAFVFGPEYTGAYWPLLILAVAHCIRTATGVLSPLLNMTENESVNMKIAAVSTGCLVVFNAVLIPLWGIKGAAVGAALSILVRRVISWRVLRSRLGMDGSVIGLPLVQSPASAQTNN
jgi:O-antigen/teichoic acid export membrane protein